MSFVGLITKKDKPCGIKLKAKVVTPDKQKYAEKIFNVKIKENAINDTTCCILDQETIVNKISVSQNMQSLTEDLTLIYNGDNGTTIRYELERSNVPYIDNYIREDGKLLGKPRYGEEDSKGVLKIFVTKGDVTIPASIEICVKAYTADEIFNDERLSKESLWNQHITYNSKNKSYQNENIIKYPLTLPDTITLSDKSAISVKIEWEIVDETLSVPGNIYYSEPRLYKDINEGKLKEYTYSDACKIVDSIKTNGLAISYNENSKETLQNMILIGGITLEAKLSLQKTEDEELEYPNYKEEDKLKYNCATYSKQINISEVEQIVLENLRLFINNPDSGNEDIRYNFNNEIHENDVNYINIINATDTNKNDFKIKTTSNNGTLYFDSNSLHVQQGQLQGITINTYYRTSDGKMDHPNQSAFDRSEDEQYEIRTINLESFKTLPEKDKQFVVCISYTIKGYDGDPVEDKELYAQFKVDTSALTANSGTSS